MSTEYEVNPKNFFDPSKDGWQRDWCGIIDRGINTRVFSTLKEAMRVAESILPLCQAVFVETYPYSGEIRILNKRGIWKTVTVTKRPPKPEFKYK